ncbi:VOC family protein [Chloroflexota bacterium]
MKVERIDHIHIYVKDAKKALQFFSELFSTKFTELGTSEELGFASYLDSLGLELVAPTSPDSAVAKAVESRGEGIAAVSFKVPNLEEAAAEMKARGIREVSRTEGPGLKEIQFHPKDCFGVLIELAEYDEEHAVTGAIRREAGKLPIHV